MMEDASLDEAAEYVQSDLQQELNRHPGYLIRRLQQISVAVFLAEAKKYDLTQLQYGSLVVVDATPGIDLRRLGRTIALDRQTVSTVVNRLTEKGLLRKETAGRKCALYTTGAGRALYHVMKARLGSVDSILLGPLTPKERGAFLETLAKLVNALNSLSRAPQTDIYEKRSAAAKAAKRKAR